MTKELHINSEYELANTNYGQQISPSIEYKLNKTQGNANSSTI
jgi:hypothetical protein